MKTDTFHHLEQAVQELDADSISLAHNMFDPLLEQIHEIVAFTERSERGGFGRDVSARAPVSWRRRSITIKAACFELLNQRRARIQSLIDTGAGNGELNETDIVDLDQISDAGVQLFGLNAGNI
ncbi:hypothetical protein [Pseudomonas syringae]|uniref:hypothetical protein n=1 Tax=Pseudomonas syringae TaxID=317 RepID=UPI001E413FC1|nr:hypothetical protein [Pseudomonas syringae]